MKNKLELGLFLKRYACVSKYIKHYFSNEESTQKIACSIFNTMFTTY